MFYNSGGTAAVAFAIAAIVVYALLVAVLVYIVYLIIRTAFLRALHSHYKTVRMFEETGEWSPRYQGRSQPVPPRDTRAYPGE